MKFTRTEQELLFSELCKHAADTPHYPHFLAYFLQANWEFSWVIWRDDKDQEINIDTL